MPELLINRRDPASFELHESARPTSSGAESFASWDRLGKDRIERGGGDANGGEAFALRPGQLPGPTPKFFFAGDPIARHVAESGVDGLWGMVAEPWREFMTWSGGWLAIEHAGGASGIESAYQALVSGELDPSVGFVITPTVEKEPG